MTDTSPILLALTKINGERDSVLPGQYSGRALVEVAYDLRVGDDYNQRIAAKVPWIKVCAVLLSKLNGTTLESVVREALAADETFGTDVKQAAEEAIGRLVDSTESECRGKVTGSARVLTVTALS